MKIRHYCNCHISGNQRYITRFVLPLGICCCVDMFISQTSWSTFTCLVSCITVETKFKTLRMDVLSKSSHAWWESFLVFNDLVSGRVSIGLPAVIQVEIFVSDSWETSAVKKISSLLDEGFTDIAVESVPRVPAHGRSPSNSVVQTHCKANKKAAE